MGNGVSFDEERKREFFMETIKKRMLEDRGESKDKEVVEYLKQKAAEIWNEDTPGDIGEHDLASDQPGGYQRSQDMMLDSISQVAAAHVLDRTAEMRASLAKKSFGRQATDTSMRSSSSADKDVDLASLLPPPRINLSIDVEAVNGGEEGNSSVESPLADGDTPKRGTKRVNSGNEGAMRIDEYNVKIGGGGLESTQQGAVTMLVPSDFLLISELGMGAGGRVYKALHQPTLTLVAVKELPMASAKKRDSLKKELKVLYTQLQGLAEDKPKEEYMDMLRGKAFRSNHVVSFYDAYSTEAGFCHVVMEYMNGGSLQDLIDKGGCRNEDLLRNIARGIAKGLKELHENKFLHRDLKPANVLMGTDGKVKVADFGVSRDLASSKDLAKTFIGTFLYMSPERIKGEDYDGKSDIWGLGMTLLASFLGRFPHEISNKNAAYWEMYDKFVSEDSHHMEDQVRAFGGSQELEDFVRLCLQKDPAERPSTALLLEHPFLAIGEGRITAASDTERIEQAKKIEILEVVTCCKEHGVKFPRKTTNFKVIAGQVGVTEEYCKDMFCPKDASIQVETIAS
ncbi:hypothetical protein TrCOL_g3481 [Triparma columacea]|uniref:mitogen-activated protein kinase kinase n=1 Tax=Triparma columacea TaxID=722753 RepID=A0A9W7LB83_9STRA|nr:hypothetical protein TrCOL_g3481 [Triparma columacea]